MTRLLRRHLLAGAATLALPSISIARALRPGDHVTVLPTLAHRAADGSLLVRIEAWVFERERNPTRTRLLARGLGLDLDELSAADRARFAQRTALFGTDAKDGRDLRVQLAGAVVAALPPSDAQGRIRAVLPHAGFVNAGQWIDWAVLGGARRFASRALWSGEQGLSVVCDIDDTVKHTQVRDRRQMLLNTFAREFVAVPGMAPWLERVVRANDSAALHYVSGSPLQLTPALLAFLREAGLPEGSLHPRALSLHPAALLDHEATTRHKHAEIAQLLADHPRRRFVLVGDSGERDPEVYGAVAREQAARIAAVLIRDVSGEAADSARYRQAFDAVAPERWRLFTDPATLPTFWR
jgi:Uncharacterized conserved protein (DUF2183)